MHQHILHILPKSKNVQYIYMNNKYFDLIFIYENYRLTFL